MNWPRAKPWRYSDRMTCAPDATFLAALEARLGPKGFTRDPQEMEPWLSDWRGRVHGRAAALLSPANVDEVQAIVQRAWILPPASRIGPLAADERTALLNASVLKGHYEQSVDRESAYE